MRPHLLQDPGQSSNCPVLASLIKEQVYVYVYGRATQLASMIKEQVYVYVYVRGAAWRHCDSENQAYICRGCMCVCLWKPGTLAVAGYL